MHSVYVILSLLQFILPLCRKAALLSRDNLWGPVLFWGLSFTLYSWFVSVVSFSSLNCKIIYSSYAEAWRHSLLSQLLVSWIKFFVLTFHSLMSVEVLSRLLLNSHRLILIMDPHDTSIACGYNDIPIACLVFCKRVSAMRENMTRREDQRQSKIKRWKKRNKIGWDHHLAEQNRFCHHLFLLFSLVSLIQSSLKIHRILITLDIIIWGEDQSCHRHEMT